MDVVKVSREDVLAGCRIDLNDAGEGDRAIQASWVAEALERQVNVEIRGARICGMFQLKSGEYASECVFVNCEFDGQVSLSRATISSITMDGCRFARYADFSGCTFVDAVQFNRAIFEAGVTFNNVNFAMAYFEDASFRGAQAQFVATRFERAIFRGATFASCTRPTFRGACFLGEALFQGATFDDKVSFQAARFQSVANFNKERRHGRTFAGTIFRSEASFAFARFDSLALCERTMFWGDAIFRSASLRTLIFSASDDFEQFNGTVDLSGCSYDHIEVDCKALLRRWGVAGVRYNRHQFVQLEKAFRGTGADEEADEIYLAMKAAERRSRYALHKRAWLTSWVYKLFANYGVRPYRLAAAMLGLLLLGTYALSQPGAAKIKPDRVEHRIALLPPEGTRVGADDADPRYWLGWRLALRELLPIELPLAGEWEPSDDRWFRWLRFSDVAACLKIAGWILVPLGVGAVAGALRTKPMGGGD